MEARFVVNIPELSKEGCRAYAKWHFRRTLMFMRVAVAIMWIGIAAYWFMVGYLDETMEFLAILALVYLFLTVFRNRLMGYSIWKASKSKTRNACFSFGENEVHIQSSMEDGRVQYNLYQRQVEAKEYFFLYISKGNAYILPKQGFVAGDPAEFAAFMEEKTGLKPEKAK